MIEFIGDLLSQFLGYKILVIGVFFFLCSILCFVLVVIIFNCPGPSLSGKGTLDTEQSFYFSLQC